MRVIFKGAQDNKIEIIDGDDQRIDDRLVDGNTYQLVRYCRQYCKIIDALGRYSKNVERKNTKLLAKVANLEQENQRLNAKIKELETELIKNKFALDNTVFYENQINTLNAQIKTLESQCVFKRGKKRKRFSPEKAEAIRNEVLSVREKALKHDTSTRTIQLINKGKYYLKYE